MSCNTYYVKILFVICILLYPNISISNELINNITGNIYNPNFSRTSKTMWTICAVLPNKNDQYWRDVEIELKKSAIELNVNIRIVLSNSYSNISQFKNIIFNRCLDGSVDAILLAAIDSDGMDDIISRAGSLNIPVIDFINSHDDRRIKSHIRVNFTDMPYKLVNYLYEINNQKKINILWVPGYPGPDWVRLVELGMKRSTKENKVKLVDTIYSLPFIRDQEKSLSNWFRENKDEKIDYIIGTAPTIMAAIKLMKTSKIKNVKLASFYYSTRLRKPLENGVVSAISYGNSKIQARLAVQVAIKSLENPLYKIDAGPEITVLTKDNIKDI